MDFSRKKLLKESETSLIRVPVSAVNPFELIRAPAYVFLKENEKFISVKAPLDFFVEAELKHLSPLQHIYFLKDHINSKVFRTAGRQIKHALTWKKKITSEIGGLENGKERLLAPTPFELSNLILQTLGPLWWSYSRDGMSVEPFFLTFFAEELCGPIRKERLLFIRENHFIHLDHALLHSSCVVFLALHLGYNQLDFIRRLRNQIFEQMINLHTMNAGTTEPQTELYELIHLVSSLLEDERNKRIKADFFYHRDENVAQKLSPRLKRIQKELMNKGSHPPTIYGKEGFINE